MLRVKRTSWHYRLWKLGRESHREPRDLCRYFWHIVLIKLLAPAVIGGMVLVGIGTLLYIIYGHPLATAISVFALLIGVAIVLGLVWLGQRWHARHKERKRDRQLIVKPPKEPNLLWEMVKARKRAMCPLIEIVDEEK